jgi:hypothetical protein
VKKMQAANDYRLRRALEIRASDMRAAADARQAAFAANSALREPFRRALGRRFIAIGNRLAADPSLAPARSR